MKKMSSPKSLQSSYDKNVERAKEKLALQITPHLHYFCDAWGLGFISGNGIWDITFPNSKTVFSFTREDVVSDGRWLIDHFSTDLSDALETDVGRCCIGCQMENYEQTMDFSYKYFQVEEFVDREDSIVKLCNLPIIAQGITNFGPISDQLAIAIYAEYKKDINLGLDLIFGCLPH